MRGVPGKLRGPFSKQILLKFADNTITTLRCADGRAVTTAQEKAVTHGRSLGTKVSLGLTQVEDIIESMPEAGKMPTELFDGNIIITE
ncbi:hypothetical protein CCR75_000677 [Bremia lactucae]|uniref:Uncharacterized protein n=1 Tax=Bremia lactucae TaxID=4779 RepID=A0A976IAW2_BRELC|nr:hypothetical protein CCR75_000677 [Bremia lactucae]